MKYSAALVTCLLSICVGSYAELTIGSGQLNWHGAYMACRRQQRFLAIIDTPQMQLEAEQLIHKNCLDTHRFWITGTNLNSPDTRRYTWFTNGKQLAYSNWHSSAPTENGHCVQLLGSEYGWKWTNMPCEHVHMYLCDDRISTICDTCAGSPPPQPRPQPARRPPTCDNCQSGSPVVSPPQPRPKPRPQPARPTCDNCQSDSPDVSPTIVTIEGSKSPISLSQSGHLNMGVAVTGSINPTVTIN